MVSLTFVFLDILNFYVVESSQMLKLDNFQFLQFIIAWWEIFSDNNSNESFYPWLCATHQQTPLVDDHSITVHLHTSLTTLGWLFSHNFCSPYNIFLELFIFNGLKLKLSKLQLTAVLNYFLQLIFIFLDLFPELTKVLGLVTVMVSCFI